MAPKFPELNRQPRFKIWEDADANVSNRTASGSSAGSAMTNSARLPSIILTEDDKERAIVNLLNQSFEDIIHNLLVDVHRVEKESRIQSAVTEIEQKADALRREQDGELESDQVIETDSATLRDGKVQLKGNPLKTVKNILCPDCRLPRLLYPRVGFNSRPVPDPTQQYCKNEPAIIYDKHDVHGQRKKGVKVKGQTKTKNKKKKDDPGSPASSGSEPNTPSTNSFATDIFEFKEIDFPAAKCPNKDSHLGDHWKPVNVFANHLNGNCYLKRDRVAGREAIAKINSTPRDSRASSPKAANGGKKARGDDEPPKKKAKLDSPKKSGSKKAGAGASKLRDTAKEDGDEISSFTTETSDTIQVASKGDTSRPGDATKGGKTKANGVTSKKAVKAGKKASGSK